MIFGLGNDSSFWAEINRKGKTVFIEDSKTWLEKVQKKHPHLCAFMVDYCTRLNQWKELLESTEVFDLALPKEVDHPQWDVILVDAPTGFDDSCPGRMKSIAAASRLAKNFGDVFVHDCERLVEAAYCDRYLKNANKISEIGTLRHYRLSSGT